MDFGDFDLENREDFGDAEIEEPEPAPDPDPPTSFAFVDPDSLPEAEASPPPAASEPSSPPPESSHGDDLERTPDPFGSPTPVSAVASKDPFGLPPARSSSRPSSRPVTPPGDGFGFLAEDDVSGGAGGTDSMQRTLSLKRRDGANLQRLSPAQTLVYRSDPETSPAPVRTGSRPTSRLGTPRTGTPKSGTPKAGSLADRTSPGASGGGPGGVMPWRGWSGPTAKGTARIAQREQQGASPTATSVRVLATGDAFTQDSPLEGGAPGQQAETAMARNFRSGIAYAGWLHKLVGKTPLDVHWKKYWFYISQDRLYYSTDDKNQQHVRYICLDRIPVRPLPHSRTPRKGLLATMPDIGVALVDPAILKQKPGFPTPRDLPKGVQAIEQSNVVGLVAGSHSYFLAASSHEEAKLWIKVLRETWYHCFKHTLRATDVKDDKGIHMASRLMAENDTLRQSVRYLTAKAQGLDSEYWRQWLEEKARNRMLEQQAASVATYEVEVKTGRMKGASSDARVYVEMYAPHEPGQATGELRLLDIDSHVKPFARDALDLFVIPCRNVGLPNTIKVWHDGTGRRPDWFLEWVRIRKKGQRNWTVFPCQRWFSTKLDDCRISRILFAGHSSPFIQYKVTVWTSDVRGAGTDANVYLIMHGTLGDGQRHVLSSGADDFERGQMNEFTIEDEELGDLLEATIGHDNTGAGPSWHMDRMTIQNTKTGQTWLFPCRMWFDTRIGDGLLERTLPVSNEMVKITPYVFLVTTSDIRGAGTDADVHVTLHGELGDTPTTVLPSQLEHFERGQTDTFRLELPFVGKLRALTVGHNNKGEGPDWHLLMVEVVEEETNKHTVFVCNKWIGLGHPEQGAPEGVLQRTLLPGGEDPRLSLCDYKLEFYTSTLRGAGTDATVSFELFGERGGSGVVRISAPLEAFERGSVDQFGFRLKHLGKLARLVVSHDNTGRNSAWHLLKVVVHSSHPDEQEPVTFICNQWLQDQDPAVHPTVELVPGGELPPTLMYKVEVATSDLKGAGTESKVFLEVFGQKGKIGPIHLDNPSAFERGATDTFIIEGPDLGPLLKLVVTCDGSGMRPLWHLDCITVWADPNATDPEEGAWFPCRAWFDKDAGFVKELFPSRRTLEIPKAKYTLQMHTSDIKNAGTDAAISVNLIGDRGDTGYTPLLANYDTFERGQTDTFELELFDVGRPQFLLVKSDGRSKKPSWHLDFAMLTSDMIPPTYFVAGLWLSSETGLEIKIPASYLDPTQDRAEYTLHVHTSDVKNAGTDAGIYVDIIGDRGTSGRQALMDTSKDTFERGQVDEFKIVTRQLGMLKALRVMHDMKGAPWHLEMIVITLDSGERYFFPYGNWLGRQTPVVELPALLNDPSLNKRVYKVVTRTSNLPQASTDANVYVEIRGNRASTPRTFLTNQSTNLFERGQADVFEVRSADLGALSELVIGHDNSGTGPNWHLEQVEITDVKMGQTWYFECNQWFDKSAGDGKIERILPASLQDPRSMQSMYKIRVKTSDKPNAGTDANVFIDLRGDQGSTGRTFLKNNKANNFERGSSDDFTLTRRSLGRLTELLIGHDNSGMGGSWHLEYVEVQDVNTGMTYYFDCNAWLSSTEEDCKLERLLVASMDNPANKRTQYKVVVVTSDRMGAGTDANVFIDIYGMDGSHTGRMLLNNKGNDFERNQTDTFALSSRDVGPMKKIRIGHDNSGVGPAWHLNRVEVTNLKTGEHRIFPANKWFSKTDDDFQIERELYPGDVPDLNVEYEIAVVTSDISGAGTDANVFIQLYGEEGEAGPLRLDNPKNNFEAGDTDLFNIKAPDVGNLKKIRIYHDNKGLGSAWHLEIVIVTNRSSGKTWYFYCGQWLDKKTGLERTIMASDVDPRSQLVTYRVTTHTSDIKGAGTDANVCLEFFGTKGSSGTRELTGKGNLFEQGKADVFIFKLADLGDLTELEIWHDGKGFGAGWHLDFVEVHSSATGKVYYFPCGRWLDKNEDDGLTRRRLPVAYKDPRKWKSRYRVTVTTSDIRGAGTDANVFIQLYGEEGDTGRINLDNPGKNDFERGNTDQFVFEAKNVGKLQKIRIGHDGTGLGAGWHLNRVIVENLDTGEVVTFVVDRWFDKGEDDGAIERELLPTSKVDEDAVNWKLLVVTATERGSGTDADVFVTLAGDKASFGPYTLPASKGAFETGSADPFSLTTPDLGRIQTLTIGHNNKGMGAAWCLNRVELDNMKTGEHYVFNFNNVWLDAKNGLSRTMAPSQVTQGEAADENIMPAAGAGRANYRLELATGLGPEGTMADGQVMVNIIGTTDQTGRQLLEMPENGFQPALLEIFGLADLPEVGTMQQLEIIHAGSAPWHVRYVRVINETSGEKAIFVCDQQLQPNTPLLVPLWVAMPCEYKVEVQTGDVFGAGTNAKIKANIFGELGSTGSTPLEYEPGKGGPCGDLCAPTPFKRAAMDTFLLHNLLDVGEIKQLEIGHDDAGMGSSWFLAWVRVTNLTTGASAFFVCDSWLAKSRGDGLTRRLLSAQSSTPPHQASLGMPSESDGAAMVTVDDPMAVFAASALARKLAGGIGPPGYKITFNTSNMCMAGTGAGVFFELIGEHGSSGPVVIKAVGQQFARGSSDIFIYPRLPYLGELLQMRVGTTGQGVFATWHLRTVEALSLGTNAKYVFNCHNWIDKKTNWQRVLVSHRVI